MQDGIGGIIPGQKKDGDTEFQEAGGGVDLGARPVGGARMSINGRRRRICLAPCSENKWEGKMNGELGLGIEKGRVSRQEGSSQY